MLTVCLAIWIASLLAFLPLLSFLFFLDFWNAGELYESPRRLPGWRFTAGLQFSAQGEDLALFNFYKSMTLGSKIEFFVGIWKFNRTEELLYKSLYGKEKIDQKIMRFDRVNSENGIGKVSKLRLSKFAKLEVLNFLQN